MTSTTGTTMPRIAKFTHKKDLPFREYTLVLTPNGDRNYTWSDIVSFRIALGNDKLRCVYGSIVKSYTTGIYTLHLLKSSNTPPFDVVVILEKIEFADPANIVELTAVARSETVN